MKEQGNSSSETPLEYNKNHMNKESSEFSEKISTFKFQHFLRTIKKRRNRKRLFRKNSPNVIGSKSLGDHRLPYYTININLS